MSEPAPDESRGLSEAEAQARLESEGYNELPRAPRRTLLRIAAEIGGEPMFELLIAAAAIYFVLGDIGEGLMLAGSALLTVAIAVFQENRTERVLEALRDLTSPRALVIRDGGRKRIPGREVVRGDIIVLSEGDRVPADAYLLSSNDLQADESLLTGESAPVRKISGGDSAIPTRPGGEDLPYVFSGTMIVRGQGIAEVKATGAASEIGRIGKALGEIVNEPSPLHAQTRRFVRILAVIGGALSILVVVLYGLMRGSWLDALLAGITLAMSILPEEFPIVLAVFLVMGAWRISRARVLTRRSAAIESLGAATVLCTDKTGTLTVNQMSVVELRAGDSILRLDDQTALPEELHELVEFGILASETNPFDPMEKAFIELGRRSFSSADHLHPDWTMVHEYGLSTKFPAMTHVWQAPGQRGYLVATKGAPETIADLCHLDSTKRTAVIRASSEMAESGLRVLGVARAKFENESWPQDPHGFEFAFAGLVGLADPIRPTVADAIRECRTAGIRVVMITGDYPGTASAIARQAGMDQSNGLIRGDQLARMSDAELREAVRTTTVFARIVPEQKLRIVNALKANGEIVAMTGDGVNDAPSLKAAHIGIAMGGRGTDVAREASAIVLLDDDFGSVVRAIRLGRRIYDNLRKAMGYLLAVHVPIAGLALLPLIVGWPLVFSPVHIAFLQLVIDPVSSIVFEAEVAEDDVMNRPPRDTRRPLFSVALIGWSLFQGLCVFLLTAIVLAQALGHGMGAMDARALTFVSLVAGNLGLVLVNRSFGSSIRVALTRPNAALWFVFSGTILILVAAFAIEPIRHVFRFGLIPWHSLVFALAGIVAVILFLELMKAILKAKRPSLAARFKILSAH